MTPAAAQIVEALGGRGDKARCPAHDDRNASLHVTQRGDRVLVKCFAGCAQDDLLDALRTRGLWPERRADRQSWLCTNPQTGEQAEHVRRDTPDGKRFHWPKGTKPRTLVYRARLNGEGPLVVTEGEKAADAAAALGCDAIATVCGASSTPNVEALADCRGRDVLLWPDNDDQGRKHMDRIAALPLMVSTVGVLDTAVLGLTTKGADAADWRPSDAVDVQVAIREASESKKPKGREGVGRGVGIAVGNDVGNDRLPTEGSERRGFTVWRPWSEVEASPAVPEAILPLLAWMAMLSCCVADSKIGKTTMLAHALAALARRERFLGGVPREGRVGVLTEMAAGWLKTWIAEHGVETADVDFLSPCRYEDLTGYVQERRPMLLVVDTLVALGTSNRADENSANDMRTLANVLRGSGCAGLAFHHTNRQGEYRGSSDIRAAVDMLIEIERTEGGGRRLSYTGRWPIEPVDLAFLPDSKRYILATDNDVRGRLLHFIRERPGCSKYAALKGAGLKDNGRSYQAVEALVAAVDVTVDADGRLFAAESS